jgi:CHASE3 domain sensor protein
VKSLPVLVLPALAVVGVLAALLSVGQDAQVQQSRVETALAIDAAAAELLSLQVEAATGVRGYLVTANPALLAPERVARRQIPVTLDRLDRLLEEQPGREPAGNLRSLVEGEMAYLQDLKALGPEIAVDRDRFAVLALQIQARTDVVRDSVAILRRYQDSIRREGAAIRDRAEARATRVAVAMALVGVIGGVGAAAALLSNVVRRVRMWRRTPGAWRRASRSCPVSGWAQTSLRGWRSLWRRLQSCCWSSVGGSTSRWRSGASTSGRSTPPAA